MSPIRTTASVRGSARHDSIPSLAALDDGAVSARHQRLLEQQAAPLDETPVLLKHCIAAVSALARLEVHCLRSELSSELALAGRNLDVAGALLLDGMPVEVERVLSEDSVRQTSRVKHVQHARAIAVAQVASAGVDRALLDRLAERSFGAANPLRSRAVGARERQRMPARQRLVNDEATIGAGLEEWTRFVERGAGDAEALLLVGASHRRWMQLRPYSRINLSLGLALTEALLHAEELVHTGTLPLAWRFARFDNEYNAMLGEDESAWLAWWVDSVGITAYQWLEILLAWERVLESLREQPAFSRSGLGTDAATVLCRPGFAVSDVMQAGGGSRAKAQRVIDDLLAAGELRECGGGRTRRFSHTQVLRLLMSISSC